MICLPLRLKLLTLGVCLIGGVSGYLISKVSFFFYNKSLNYYNLRIFFGSIWFIPIISTTGRIYYPLELGSKTVKNFDQG